MKTLIIAINSKYIHSSLAPWYLKSSCGADCGEVKVIEHTINETIHDVLMTIYLNKPDVATFSCYIWNIGPVLRLASNLKKLLPETVVVLGGPEVSYDAEERLNDYPFVDYVLAGEGEESFPRLLRNLVSENQAIPLSSIEGLFWRRSGRVESSRPAIIRSLDDIPSPYTEEMLAAAKNRILYFETSRGCPYSCSYCLSSATSGTRFFSLERVFIELDRLVATGVRQIKFVDRTFNSSKSRAIAIWKHICELDEKARQISGEGGLECNFHFEVGADLFDEETIEILSGAPKGLFQIEAGVQTVNAETLAAVNRKTDTERLLFNLKRLGGAGNIHIHADLIAGLPGEDYESFEMSFDRVYQSGPNQLQLGFLKFLKGTRMREEAIGTGYRFDDAPPYEILSGPVIGYDKLLVLKGIAALVERYYNSGSFSFSIQYIIQKGFSSPFSFYERFYSYCRERGCLTGQTAFRDWYAFLWDFASLCLEDSCKADLKELLRLDFLASDPSGSLPAFLEKRTDPAFHDWCFEFLRKNDIGVIFPEMAGMPPKQIFKKVHFDLFHIDAPDMAELLDFPIQGNGGAPSVVLFCHTNRDKVTGRYPYFRISPF